jgi:hypothetical protein
VVRDRWFGCVMPRPWITRIAGRENSIYHPFRHRPRANEPLGEGVLDLLARLNPLCRTGQ